MPEEAVPGVQSAGFALRPATSDKMPHVEGVCSILWLLIWSQAHGTEPG